MSLEAEAVVVKDLHGKPLTGPKKYFRELLINKWLKSTLSHGTVLDAGCGNKGTIMIRLANDDFTVYGVDISEDCIELIRRRVKSQGLSHRIKVQRDDLSALTFQDNLFDGIVCEEVLEHLENDERTVKELYRVLKPGGICVVTVPSNNLPLDDIDRYYGHLRKYSRAEFERLFQMNNFDVVKTEYYGFPVARLWRQCVAVPYMRSQIKKSGGKMRATGKNTFLTPLSLLISQVFSIDNLFNRFPFGIGLIGMFSKPPQMENPET